MEDPPNPQGIYGTAAEGQEVPAQWMIRIPDTEPYIKSFIKYEKNDKITCLYCFGTRAT